MPRGDMIFVTGTDTGVGKTVLTALLLAHLRRNGIHTLAAKPFCSGSRGDAVLLRKLQDNELSLDELNPFFFEEPIAPLAAARLHRREVPMLHVLEHLEGLARRCECLLVEGAGGLLAPLGEPRNEPGKQRPRPVGAPDGRSRARKGSGKYPAGAGASQPGSGAYSLFELIARLGGKVVVVAPDRLGTINHTLLTARALMEVVAGGTLSPRRRASRATGAGLQVVLMGQRIPDRSHESNRHLIAEALAPARVGTLPFLGGNLRAAARIRSAAAALARGLELLVRS